MLYAKDRHAGKENVGQLEIALIDMELHIFITIPQYYGGHFVYVF
jgi:hypothetical protein